MAALLPCMIYFISNSCCVKTRFDIFFFPNHLTSLEAECIVLARTEAEGFADEICQAW